MIREALRRLPGDALLPGADASTPLLAVSRSGASVTGLPVLGPAEIVAAWR